MTFVHAPHEPGTSILDVLNLRARYDSREVLSGLSFSLAVGERVGVVGPNGAGKSTLLRIIAGLQEPSEGTVSVFGHRPVGHICIAYLPQRAQIDWNFPLSVRDVVMMGRVGSLGLLRRARASDHELVRDCLEQVGLTDLAGRQISELSGGQQQRMFIARALAMRAELMLMDEPLGALDMQSQQSILDIIDRLARRKVTIMVALHDLQIAADHFDRVMLLNREIIRLGEPSAVFTESNILRAYGGHALSLKASEGRIMLGDTCGEGEHTHDAPV